MPDINPETPCYPVEVLLTGEFDCQTGYDVWRSRGTPEWLFIFTVSGAGLVGVRGRQHSLTAGDAVLFQPGTPQRYLTDPSVGRWRILWCHFNLQRDWRLWVEWPELERGLRCTHIKSEAMRNQVCRSFREVIRLWCRQLPLGLAMAINAFERTLLLVHATDEGRALDPRVRRALDELSAHSSESFDLATLARRCGLSPSRLGHLFREQVGLPPQHYHERLRLQKAALLLHSTGHSIKEIARQTGYQNAFYFTNRFRKAFGCSPSAFRNRQ